jgi:uncharacterized surface protein with fasciclin (FAS1) repeats
MKNHRFAALAVAASATLLGAACTSDSTSPQSTRFEDGVSSGSQRTIAEVVAGDPRFATLLEAVDAAGLRQTLTGDRPVTVFAPTDDAFGALPKKTVDALLKPANEAQLEGILTYHVVPDAVMAADVEAGALKTVNGDAFQVSLDGSTVEITDGRGNTAEVIAADIDASNGVIHAIDEVLLPPSR